MSIHEAVDEEEEETVPFGIIPGLSWTEALERHLNEFKAFNPTDRYGYVHAIAKMVAVLGMSMGGWSQWMQKYVMTLFTEEELKDLYTKFKALAIPLVELDFEVTKSFENKTRPPKSETETKKKTNSRYA